MPSAEVEELNSTVEVEEVPLNPPLDAVITTMELENHEETASPERHTAGEETEVKPDSAPALHPEASTPKDGPLPNPDLPQGVSPTGDSSISPSPDAIPEAITAPNDVDDPSKSTPDGDSTPPCLPAPEFISFSATTPHSSNDSSLAQGSSSLPDPINTPLPDSLAPTPVSEPLVDVNALPSSSVPADSLLKEGEGATLTVDTSLPKPVSSSPATEPLVEVKASPSSITPVDLPSKESADDTVKDMLFPEPAKSTPVTEPVEIPISPSKTPPEDTLSKESTDNTITIDDSYYLTLPPLPPSPIDEPRSSTVPPTTVAEDTALSAPPPRTNPSSPLKGSNTVSPPVNEPQTRAEEPHLPPKKSATPSNGNPWAFLDEVPSAKASPPPPAPPPKNNPFMNAKSPVKEKRGGGLFGGWGLGSSPSVVGGGLIGSF
ncbi:hypothetical protein CPB85DRAFT_667754 [Mucidula mucida]|nr:hypothetical protein CPB85DRAFT_667754 [Mucidula mucida]